MSTLILIRHGQSQWNAENRFTGWVDTPLSEQGREEAHKAGRRLADRGLGVDLAFTSTLQRAIETGRIVLGELGQGDLEQTEAWQLNERFYGALTGRNKAQTAEEFGEEQVRIWRRSYDIPPPGGESLADTGRRALPYFHAEVLPATDRVATVMVAAHGNSLRAIMKDLEQISDDDIPKLEIPTGVPIVYEISDRAVTGKEILD
ncbi:MAG TPA: 2,3-diphosphoglycerate-dependent phosphoglycerate mutase [Egibacteraceae bacterium]|nr:2,3-diphosphoglycerate-dependent phosphoglycerate mutase [Egibacteraceae bacterium]